MYYKTNAEIKKEARELLKGNWSKAIILCIPLYVISILSAINSNYSISIDEYGNIIYSQINVIFIFILSLLTVFVTAGVSFTLLGWLRKNKIEPSEKDGLSLVFNNNMSINLILISILTYIFTYLWTLLLIIPGIIKSLSYTQTTFILFDNAQKNNVPTISNLDCITQSRKLMDGHKGKYFLFYLSFIGWFFLGGLTFGIGLIWIFPYFYTANAAFYKNLVDIESPETEVSNIIE